MMAIYILERVSPADYDEFSGFVIRADSETSARRIAANTSRYETVGAHYDEDLNWVEGDPVWTDPKYSTCKVVSTSGESAVILSDFRAG